MLKGIGLITQVQTGNIIDEILEYQVYNEVAKILSFKLMLVSKLRIILL